MKQNIFYTIENTGWSGGISWFEGARGTRFYEETDARKAIEIFKKEVDDPDMLHRMVKHTHIHEENKHTHIEEFIHL